MERKIPEGADSHLRSFSPPDPERFLGLGPGTEFFFKVWTFDPVLRIPALDLLTKDCLCIK